MKCTICKCGAPLSNLGHECTSPFGVPVMAVFVPTVDKDGVENGILKTQDLNKAYFDLMTSTATDPDKRWYPSPKFKNVINTRADAKFWEADDQSVEFVSEAARKFAAIITQQSGTGATSPAMKKQIESARCSNGLSVFLFSEDRQILCKESADGLSVLPVQIDEQSVYAGFVFKTKEQNQHLGLSFNFSVTEKDEDLRLIDCSEIDGYDILMLRALLDICYDLIDVKETALKIKLRSNFGSAINPFTADGLVINDFISADDDAPGQLYNETQDANIAITDLTESPDGTYLIEFAAQSLADVIVIKPTKTTYDFSCVEANPVDIDS